MKYDQNTDVTFILPFIHFTYNIVTDFSKLRTRLPLWAVDILIEIILICFVDIDVHLLYAWIFEELVQAF